jgi:hypothetical protein
LHQIFDELADRQPGARKTLGNMAMDRPDPHASPSSCPSRPRQNARSADISLAQPATARQAQRRKSPRSQLRGLDSTGEIA